MKNKETINASISAVGIASHIPSTPINKGRSIIAPDIKTNVLINDIIAETLPFERAVNIAEAKMLNPENKNVMENNKYALVAIG